MLSKLSRCLNVEQDVEEDASITSARLLLGRYPMRNLLHHKIKINLQQEELATIAMLTDGQQCFIPFDRV